MSSSGQTSTQDASPWLGRFVAPRALRQGGSYRMYATERVATGQPAVVITGNPASGSSEVARALDEMARVHGLLDSPHIPGVDERGAEGDIEFLALRADAIATLEDLRTVGGPEDVLSYQAGWCVIAPLLEALAVAHATVDPASGKPICLGALSTRNILVSPDGELLLLGFGHPLLGNVGSDGRPGLVFQTAEVWAGAEPSPGDDLVAVVQLAFSLLPWVQLPPVLSRIMSGAPAPEDAPMAAALGEVLQRTIYAPPWQRLASVHTYRELHGRVLALLGVQPDPASAADFLGRLARRARDATPGLDPAALDDAALAVGREWNGGRYWTEAVLGKGASGTVFRARDRQLRQTVALKLVRRTEEDAAADRFRREVRILRNVQHPNVLRGYDLFEDGPWLGAVIEYVEGDTLSAFLRDNPGARLAAARMLADLADGLQALHDAGVVHRDLKPTNILVHERRGAILVDLGIAREMDATRELTATAARLGTLAYMSPEQLAGRRVGPPSDVFSLALVVLEVLTDERPAPEGRADASNALALLRASELPPALQAVLEPALHPEPEQRPSAAQLGAQLRAALATALDSLTPDALLVEQEAAWFRPPHGTSVDVSRRRPLRLILLTLVRQRQRAGHDGLSLEALVTAGWPEERILPEAAANRLHVALSTLRKLGLKDLIELSDRGYRLAPGVPVVFPATAA